MTESDKIALMERELVRLLLRIHPSLESYQEIKHRLLIILNMQQLFLKKKTMEMTNEDRLELEKIVDATVKAMLNDPEAYR